MKMICVNRYKAKTLNNTIKATPRIKHISVITFIKHSALEASYITEELVLNPL